MKWENNAHYRALHCLSLKPCGSGDLAQGFQMLGKHSANGATSPILIYPHFTSKTVFQTVCGGVRLSSQNLGDDGRRIRNPRSCSLKWWFQDQPWLPVNYFSKNKTKQRLVREGSAGKGLPLNETAWAQSLGPTGRKKRINSCECSAHGWGLHPLPTTRTKLKPNQTKPKTL